MSLFETIRHFLSKVEFQDFIVFIFFLVFLNLLTYGIEKFAKKITSKFPKKRMRVFQWVPLLNFTIYFAGLIFVFFIIFDPKQELILGLLASILIAIGFALKDMVSSVLAGIILLVDKPFQVGDRVSFKDVYGDIKNIGLWSTKLLTLDDSLITIPNHCFLTDLVSSSSAGELGMMVSIDVYVSHTANLFLARKILERIAINSEYVQIQEKITIVSKEVLGISGILSILLKTKCVIKDSRTEKLFQTAFIMNVNEEFKMQNIAR
jgi:small-conductance mechanosensitive channel